MKRPRAGTDAADLWDMRIGETRVFLPACESLNPNWVSATAAYLRLSYDPRRRYRSQLMRNGDGVLVGITTTRLADTTEARRKVGT